MHTFTCTTFFSETRSANPKKSHYTQTVHSEQDLLVYEKVCTAKQTKKNTKRATKKSTNGRIHLRHAGKTEMNRIKAIVQTKTEKARWVV